MTRRHASLGATIALVAWSSFAPRSARAAMVVSRGAAEDRFEDPVVVSASLLPELRGLGVGQLAVFRYDAGSDAFVPIPFQVDQRVDHAFNPGSPYEVHELMYDVFGEDDGLLDDDDEIVFLDSDAGGAASSTASWPPLADPNRFEIRIVDPRPEGPFSDRYVYVFTGGSLTRSPTAYVAWSTAATTSIVSPQFVLDFADRWLLTGYRVSPPCGTGEDLIDRVKGRAGFSPDRAESEETWNPLSIYLGGIVGPVRAIRYVQGAASGVNTVHHDLIYRGFWERVVNLRVHPISAAWFYFDLRPKPGTMYYSSTVPGGVAVDGVSDPSVPTTIPEWSIVRGPGGGFAILYDVPPSPFVGEFRYYYRDDSSYNDKPVTVPTYGDEDDAAFGNHGVQLATVTSQETDTIPVSFRLYPLCSDEGDASLGNDLRELADYPLGASATLQTRAASAVSSLRMVRSGLDVALGWQTVAGATSYRVYGATAAALPRGSWTLLGEVAAPPFVDAGGASDGVDRYYSVVAVAPGGEGPW